MKSLLERLKDKTVTFFWVQSRPRVSPAHLEQRNNYFCDKELLDAFVLDSEVTKVFEDENPGRDLFKNIGVENAFVATRSGLTRWKEYNDKRQSNFTEANNKGIDEVWYKKAVEYNNKYPSSFVFSVPFDSSDNQ